jgi:shikimate kinase
MLIPHNRPGDSSPISSPKVVLIGFMASGKSTIAKRLAELLAFSVTEIDSLIVQRAGGVSISEIFERHGEDYFRDLESAVCASLVDVQGVVISTGGGVITRDTNLPLLKANGGTVVFLRSNFETIAARHADLSTRPLFRSIARARELFEQRAPTYHAWADLIVDTDGKEIEQVCSEIYSALRYRT